jgi:ribosomal protein S8
VERQPGNRPSAKAPHRLELLRRPSARSQQRVTLRQMVGRVPNLNAVYLLETPMGILTTREARFHKVGGRAIAIL